MQIEIIPGDKTRQPEIDSFLGMLAHLADYRDDTIEIRLLDGKVITGSINQVLADAIEIFPLEDKGMIQTFYLIPLAQISWVGYSE